MSYFIMGRLCLANQASVRHHLRRWRRLMKGLSAIFKVESITAPVCRGGSALPRRRPFSRGQNAT